MIVLRDSYCSDNRSRSSGTVVSPGRLVRLVERGREKTKRRSRRRRTRRTLGGEHLGVLTGCSFPPGRQGWSERVRLVEIPPTLFSQGNIRARNPRPAAFGPRETEKKRHAPEVDDMPHIKYRPL